MLVIVSLITQYFVYGSHREAKRSSKPYSPVRFRHPNKRGVSFSNSALINQEEESSEEEDAARCFAQISISEDPSEAWAANLETPKSCWFFLTVVVSTSCVASFCFTFFVSWSGDTSTNFLIGLFYILTNAFCLWSIIEFFFTTLWFHTIRLVCGIPQLPMMDFSTGLPRKGRTILSYCLLSKTRENSKGTMETALEAHLANLDPYMRITTGVISVTSELELVCYEMELRDACRQVIREKLAGEAQAFCRLAEAGALQADGRGNQWKLRYALEALEEGSGRRVGFWLSLWESLGKIRGAALRVALLAKVEEAALHFIYLHRACRILKKPGQYQDLMVLASTGNNAAYTYLKEDYGEKFGRELGSECFGFSGNISKPSSSMEDVAKFEMAVHELMVKGKPDIDLVAGLGADPKNRYFYTMVLDSDTVCPPGSIRSLVEYAEHPSNRSYGIINANLATDYRKDSDDITWHMWRNALMEVSTVNLQRGQFWIFDRVGFYGKGLIKNEMYISRLIGMPGEPIEALPVDILSHDTVEAKLLQPAVATSVTLYEDVARNPISALSQSTRWMFGEVRNSCYAHDGSYRGVIRALTAVYNFMVCKPRPEVFIRWHDVPTSVGAEYLSLTGFRLFHAGPCILMVNVATSLASRQWGLQLEVLPVVGMYAFLFTVLALFIIPKGFLILDKLPSLNCGKYILCTKKASKVGDGGFKSETEDEEDSLVSGVSLSVRDLRSSVEDSDLDNSDAEEEVPLGACSVLIRQLALALIEIILSVLLFSPELILGVIRLVRASWSQVTGSANWQPQEEVENEIRNNLSISYVWKKCSVVFVAGAAYLSFALWFKMMDALLYLLIASWLLYPISTYWMCLPVSGSWKKSFLWKWVMDIKRIQ